MRASWRFGIAVYAAAAIFGSAPALAQNTAAPATNTANPPPAETVGPRELRDFSLPGTVTRPAPTPPERAPAPAPSTTTPRTTAPAPTNSAPPRNRPAASPVREAPNAGASVDQSLPASDPLAAPLTDAPVTAEVAPTLEPAPVAPEITHPNQYKYDFLPWLITVLLLGAGAAFLFWRQRSQPSYASASAAAYAAPQPRPRAQPAQRPEPLQRAPSPQPQPAARPTSQPGAKVALQPAARPAARPMPQPASTFGMVTTSLRPWLDIEFSPGRCVVENDKATIQFDVAVTNTGSAPARDVLIEASMFNAGPAQDQEIGAFFAHPVAKGDRIPAIAPLKRVALKSKVSLTREQLRQFEIAGRKLFVPLVGVNALYRWGGGEGQTSACYVVGRDTQSEKMAPLRLDLGPRIFRGLGARPHTVSVRN